MATSTYFVDADWRSNTDTPYIAYGEKAYKNPYNQDYLSNHSYLFYNGGAVNINDNKNDSSDQFINSKNHDYVYKQIKSPYLYSYLPPYKKAYIPSLYSSYDQIVAGDMSGGTNNKNNINILKDRDIHSGEPLIFKTKDLVGPNPCFQPYTYSSDSVIDPYFLPDIDKNLPPVNYYYDGGSNRRIRKQIKVRKQSKKYIKRNNKQSTEKKAPRKRYTRKYSRKN